VDGIARSLVLSTKRLDIARTRLGSVSAANIGEVQFSIEIQPLGRNVQQFRGGLVFKAHRLLYHSTLGGSTSPGRASDPSPPPTSLSHTHPLSLSLSYTHTHTHTHLLHTEIARTRLGSVSAANIAEVSLSHTLSLSYTHTHTHTSYTHTHTHLSHAPVAKEGWSPPVAA